MTGPARHARDLDVAAVSRDRLDAVAGVAASLERVRRELVTELIGLWSTSAWLAAGARSAKDYLVAYTHLSEGEAFRLARLGERCAAHPALADAVTSGVLSVARAQLLAKVAIDEREPWLADSLASLLKLGTMPGSTDVEWSTAVRHWAELVDQERSLRHEPAHTLSLSQSLFGGGEIHGSLSPSAFLNVATALDRWMQDPDPAGAAHRRSFGERRADALDDLAHHANTCNADDPDDDEPWDAEDDAADAEPPVRVQPELRADTDRDDTGWDDIDWDDLAADDVFDGWSDTDLFDQELAHADDEDVDPLDLLRRHLRAVECQRRRRMRRRVKPRSGVTTVVHIDLHTLADLHGEAVSPGEVDYQNLVLRGEGWNLTRAAAERLLCDSSLAAVLFGGRNQILDANPANPQFTVLQRRAIAARDRHCVFPSCTRVARHCDIHHHRPRETGGPTTTVNGVLLCRHHHRLVHEFGWALRIGPDGRWIAIDAYGHHWTGRPARPDRRAPPEAEPDPRAGPPGRTVATS